MKKTKTSAHPVGRHLTMRIPIDDFLHLAFSTLARRHGLTITQAYVFLIRWAVSNSTLTPDIGDDDERWKRG